MDTDVPSNLTDNSPSTRNVPNSSIGTTTPVPQGHAERANTINLVTPSPRGFVNLVTPTSTPSSVERANVPAFLPPSVTEAAGVPDVNVFYNRLGNSSGLWNGFGVRNEEINATNGAGIEHRSQDVPELDRSISRVNTPNAETCIHTSVIQHVGLQRSRDSRSHSGSGNQQATVGESDSSTTHLHSSPVSAPQPLPPLIRQIDSDQPSTSSSAPIPSSHLQPVEPLASNRPSTTVSSFSNDHSYSLVNQLTTGTSPDDIRITEHSYSLASIGALVAPPYHHYSRPTLRRSNRLSTRLHPYNSSTLQIRGQSSASPVLVGDATELSRTRFASDNGRSQPDVVADSSPLSNIESHQNEDTSRTRRSGGSHHNHTPFSISYLLSEPGNTSSRRPRSSTSTGSTFDSVGPVSSNHPTADNPVFLTPGGSSPPQHTAGDLPVRRPDTVPVDPFAVHSNVAYHHLPSFNIPDNRPPALHDSISRRNDYYLEDLEYINRAADLINRNLEFIGRQSRTRNSHSVPLRPSGSSSPRDLTSGNAPYHGDLTNVNTSGDRPHLLIGDIDTQAYEILENREMRDSFFEGILSTIHPESSIRASRGQQSHSVPYSAGNSVPDSSAMGLRNPTIIVNSGHGNQAVTPYQDLIVSGANVSSSDGGDVIVVDSDTDEVGHL